MFRLCRTGAGRVDRVKDGNKAFYKLVVSDRILESGWFVNRI